MPRLEQATQACRGDAVRGRDGTLSETGAASGFLPTQKFLSSAIAVAGPEAKAETMVSNASPNVVQTSARRLAMLEAAKVFQSHRRRLLRVANRMLGSRVDAEDLLQETYLRWHRSANSNIQSPIAFLVTITRRLCLDRLRQLKQESEQYAVPSGCEAIVEDQFPSPERQLELAEEVPIAFLAVLERLGPEERAAFLLRDMFDYDYSEVAQILGKAEPACRQITHRARTRVRESRSRFSVTTESRDRVLEKLVAAVAFGDRQSVMALLAEKVEYVSACSGRLVAEFHPRFVTDRTSRNNHSAADDVGVDTCRRLAGTEGVSSNSRGRRVKAIMRLPS